MSILLCCCKLFISIFNSLLSSCKFYSVGPRIGEDPPRLLSSKHLLLAYWSKGLGLWRKTLSTIVLLTTLWNFQFLGNHFMWPRKCILSHLKCWLELIQSLNSLLLISQHSLVCNGLNLFLLHWIFKLKCFLTFYFLQVIVCWHAIILADTYWHLMEIKRSLTRFFILFFKMKDLEAKKFQNIR